jgi:hypothetical protein
MSDIEIRYPFFILGWVEMLEQRVVRVQNFCQELVSMPFVNHPPPFSP